MRRRLFFFAWLGIASSGACSSFSSTPSADGATDGGALDGQSLSDGPAPVTGEPGPTVTFTPASVPVGTLLTVTGEDLSSVQSISVGGVAAVIVSQSTASATALLMPGTKSGAVTVTTSSGQAGATATFAVTSTGVPKTQVGDKLVGSGASAGAKQGRAVALSADGRTGLVGGAVDDSGIGAAWVYARPGAMFSQQGSKLVGTGASGAASQAVAVALSADGSTALVGGFNDDSGVGAVWVYTRAGQTWTQQGSKLVGTDGSAAAGQGYSVALSADGNTALVGGFGGYADSSNEGAVWVFARAGGTWTQQGSKLLGADASGVAKQGTSVALSADGNTALVGGPNDSSYVGAAWVYTRTGGTWTQQGSKLVGAGALGASSQGNAVALSADGKTALVGGGGDNSGVGAAWVFTRAGSVWSEQGSKLVGSAAAGAAGQGGGSVALSADGDTALVAGSSDNSGAGAVWVYARAADAWTQQGPKLVGSGSVGAATQGIAVSLSADGNTALVGGFNDNGGAGAVWVFAP